MTRIITFSLLFYLSSAVAQSQTEFGIKPNDADIEEEYRDELDKWMLQAYEGDRDAQFKVGVLFTNNQFDPPDYEHAVYWYKQAARQGHVLAQYNLGHQYLAGVGVAKNEKSGVRWWLAAAKQDHALAQFNVGRAYYLGIGLEQDHKRSKYWFRRAATNQEPKSIEILKQLGWYDDNLVSATLSSQDADVGLVVGKENKNTMRQDRKTLSETQNSGDTADLTLASRITPVKITPARIAPVDIPKIEAKSQNTEIGDLTPTTEATSQLKTEAHITPKPTPPTPLRKTPIALYTDPAVRSVLIAIVDDHDNLVITERGDDWSKVKSITGFPVWVHNDFLNVDGSQGTITGNSLNARSVPIISNGTVVGKLHKGEKVKILYKRKAWHRIIAPARFQAWVKTEDFNRWTTPMVVLNQPDSKWSNSQQHNPPNATMVAANSIRLNKNPALPDRSPSPTSALSKAAAAKENDPTVTQIKISTVPYPRPVNDNQWLFKQPVDSFTLQLASFDDLAKTQKFIADNKFIDNPSLHQFTAKGKDIEWTYFLYGSYAQRENAESIKKKINQKRAWVRTFGRLQQNRCVSWKTQLPPPRELNKYCSQ